MRCPRGPLACLVLAFLCCAALLWSAATPVHADDEPAPALAQPAGAQIDYMGLLARTQDELSRQAGPAPWEGHDGALAYIWKAYVQKRGKRAQRYVEQLQKPSRWVFEEQGERALMLDPDSWSPFVQRLAKAYSELAAARDGLKKINVSPKSALRNWHARHPEPDLNRRTPAERALDSLRRSIRLYRAQGKVVPHWLYVREDALVEEALHERRLLEAAHRQWKLDRQAAIRRIHAAVAETKEAARLERERIELHLRNFAVLVADLGLKEEARLRDAVAGLPADEKLAAAAKKDFADMAKGRAALKRYNTAKSSKWSSLVRQGWMRPRNHLVSSLKTAGDRAERAAAEADKPAAGSAADAAPREGDGG